jgi:hypothetical protein
MQPLWCSRWAPGGWQQLIVTDLSGPSRLPILTHTFAARPAPPRRVPRPADSVTDRPHSSLGIGEGADTFSIYADSSAKGTPADSGSRGDVTSRRLSFSFGRAHHPIPAGAAAATVPSQVLLPAAAKSQLQPGLLPLQANLPASPMPPVL